MGGPAEAPGRAGGVRMPVDVSALVEVVRSYPGVTAKSEIGLVSEVFESTDWLAGPGDDGAVVTEAGMSFGGGGEAILPSFAAADPYGAGVGAGTPQLKDLAGVGGRPLGLVDTGAGQRGGIPPGRAGV